MAKEQRIKDKTVEGTGQTIKTEKFSSEGSVNGIVEEFVGITVLSSKFAFR